MKISFISSEANPLIKTGGLGDVVYSLAKEEILLGQDVSIVIPFYNKINDNLFYPLIKIASFYVNLSWRHELAEVYKLNIEGIDYYLISNPHYFNRHRPVFY